MKSSIALTSILGPLLYAIYFNGIFDVESKVKCIFLLKEHVSFVHDKIIKGCMQY